MVTRLVKVPTLFSQYLPRVSGPRPSPTWFTIGGAAVLVSLANLVTYDTLADGDYNAYQTHVIASICFGLLGSAAIAVHADFRNLAIPSALLFCTLAPGVMHAIRLTNPFLNGRPISENGATKSNPAMWNEAWDFLAPDATSISIAADGALEMAIRPWKSASIRAKAAAPISVHPLQVPLGLKQAILREEVDVTASTNLTGNYLGVIQSNRTRVQIVSYGIKLTVPDNRGDVGSIDIPAKAWADGALHRWQLIGSSSLLTLKLDGSVLWEGPQREQLEPVLIGDAQSDGEHGGSLEVVGARFTRRLAVGSP